MTCQAVGLEFDAPARSSDASTGIFQSVALATGETGRGRVVSTRIGSTNPLKWFAPNTRPRVCGGGTSPTTSTSRK